VAVVSLEGGGTTYFKSFSSAWDSAKASSSVETPATLKLLANITAGSGGFGSSDGATLNVADNNYIILDLNGYILNRNLTSAIEGGNVITVLGNQLLMILQQTKTEK
jgi:hypothetical protein